MKLKKEQVITWRNAVIITILVVLIFNTYQIMNLKGIVSEKVAQAAEETRPAKMAFILLRDDSCDDCTDITPIIDAIKRDNIDVVSERNVDASSAEGKGLIADYGIERLPALIVQGEVDKERDYQTELDRRDDAFIFDATPAPYVDTATMEVAGKVSVTILKDNACTSCANMSVLVDQLRFASILITRVTELDYTSQTGAALVERYSIKKIPAVLLSKDANVYEIITQSWQQVGTIEDDGTFIAREAGAPYVDVQSGDTKGLIEGILIDDPSCEECYDVELHRRLILQLGIDLSDARTVAIDSPEGRELMEAYDLNMVPTVIIKGDTGEYPALESVWPRVGTIEDDGTAVFRNPAPLQGVVYRNLSTGEIEGGTEQASQIV